MMNIQNIDKMNILMAVLHIKEAATLLETSNLDVSQALYTVALSLIQKEQLSEDDIKETESIKNQLEQKIDEQN